MPFRRRVRTPSFSQFACSTIAFNASQQLKGLGASIDSSLLTETFGSGSTAAPELAASSTDDASMAALLAAYVSTKSLSPVALAYLQHLPANSTTSTLL